MQFIAVLSKGTTPTPTSLVAKRLFNHFANNKASQTETDGNSINCAENTYKSFAEYRESAIGATGIQTGSKRVSDIPESDAERSELREKAQKISYRIKN